MKQIKRLTVLYADDNEDSGEMLTTLLGLSEIDVLLARSVKEAFQTAQNEHFDLFLLESSFPDGSGYDLCRQLREFNPYTPIVFYSGDAFEADKQKGMRAGADAYLIKPEINTIASTIFQLLTLNPETKSAVSFPSVDYYSPQTETGSSPDYFEMQPDLFDSRQKL